MNNIEITNKECDWKDENGYVTAVPNHTYIKLRLVKSNAANGKNETIIMQANDDGKTFFHYKRRYWKKVWPPGSKENPCSVFHGSMGRLFLGQN